MKKKLTKKGWMCKEWLDKKCSMGFEVLNTQRFAIQRYCALKCLKPCKPVKVKITEVK